MTDVPDDHLATVHADPGGRTPPHGDAEKDD